MVDGGALVAEGVDGSLGIDGDADGEASSDAGGGRAGGWEVFGIDAWHELEFGAGLGRVEGGGSLLIVLRVS